MECRFDHAENGRPHRFRVAAFIAVLDPGVQGSGGRVVFRPAIGPRLTAGDTPWRRRNFGGGGSNMYAMLV